MSGSEKITSVITAEAKAAADYITDTCDNDGVAKVLEKIVNGEL